MAKINIVIISSGRYNYLDQTLSSMFSMVNFCDHDIDIILHEDRTIKYNENSGKQITEKYNIKNHIVTDNNLGPIPAVKNAWLNLKECDYVWHQEEDFIYNKNINIDDFIKVIESTDVKVSQLLVERDNHNAPLKKLLGFIDINIDGINVCKHPSNFFSTNPHLIKKSEIDNIINCDILTSEYEIAMHFLNKGYVSCYYGTTNETNYVTHIGVERIGNYSQW